MLAGRDVGAVGTFDRRIFRDVHVVVFVVITGNRLDSERRQNGPLIDVPLLLLMLLLNMVVVVDDVVVVVWRFRAVSNLYGCGSRYRRRCVANVGQTFVDAARRRCCCRTVGVRFSAGRRMCGGGGCVAVETSGAGELFFEGVHLFFGKCCPLCGSKQKVALI